MSFEHFGESENVRPVHLEPELELQIVGVPVDHWVTLALVYLRWAQQLLVGFAILRGLHALRRLLQLEPRWQHLAEALALGQIQNPKARRPYPKFGEDPT